MYARYAVIVVKVMTGNKGTGGVEGRLAPKLFRLPSHESKISVESIRTN